MEMARAGRSSIQSLNTGEKKQGDVAGDIGPKETIEKLIVQLKQREDEVKQTRETCAHLEASLTELRAQLPSPPS
jgi:ubiquinone biosynthesis protein UbiJ